MCGIFGLVLDEKCGAKNEKIELSIRRLIRLSERRGREATGLVVARQQKIAVYKQATKPSAMLRSKEFSHFLRRSLTAEGMARPLAVIGHTRLVTNGSQAFQENNQPICNGHLVGIHNGIVTNDQTLAERYPGVRNGNGFSDSDSEVLFGLINKYYQEKGNLTQAIANTFQDIEGSASIAFFSDDLPVLALSTNTGSLYFTHQPQKGLFAFASEKYILLKFLKKSRRWLQGEASANSIEPLSGVVFNFDTHEIQSISLKKTARETPYKKPTPLTVLRSIVDESQPPTHLRRCLQCILPETYPFIEFDAAGVCNYCRSYQRQIPQGSDALEKELVKYRSKDGKPDCIVGLSGGRDSSYGMHVLVKEFGMHPIAYTYDWALVTDLARRNQARICGKLGIEHIIRAADIHTKRRYIRKNIYAWLKKPELGMVPLFMAGDKPFYYYGSKLRRETGIDFTIFCAGHQVEQMEFKAGFCGVDQSLTNNTKLYHFKWGNKLRLAAWYSKQYLTNPSYINESVWDSIFSFYCSFINKDDYLYLYYYIPWDEKVMEKTLKGEYGWESDERYGKNQWRMGDGQTAFTNYIYHAISGFSEFDNFRSNQIREGLLARDEALQLVAVDNKPRLEMLQDFSQLIGFNLEEVLLKINSIPKLYGYPRSV